MNLHPRGALISAIIGLFFVRMGIVAIFVIFGWIAAELFCFSRRFGRKGLVAYAGLVAVCCTFLTYQGYVLWSNFSTIAQAEAHGASHASMSGGFLPGYISYVALGPGVGDEELEAILALDGMENLEEIVAGDSQITDDGLRMLSHLKYINLLDSQVTEEAIVEFEQSHPNCRVVYERAYDIGAEHLRASRYEEAIVQFNKAIRVRPDDAKAYHDRGAAWVNSGEFDKAIADFDEAIRLKLMGYLVYYNRGYAWASKGEYAKAIADFREAARLNISNPDPRLALGWVLATCPQDEIRDGEQAVDQRSAHTCDGGNCRAHGTVALPRRRRAGDFV